MALTKLKGYTFEIPQEHLDNPELITNVWTTLPSGVKARFLRVDHWVPATLPEKLTKPSEIAEEYLIAPFKDTNPVLRQAVFGIAEEHFKWADWKNFSTSSVAAGSSGHSNLARSSAGAHVSE